MKKFTKLTMITMLSLLFAGCTPDVVEPPIEDIAPIEQVQEEPQVEDSQANEESEDLSSAVDELIDSVTESTEQTQSSQESSGDLGSPDTTNHTLIKVDGGDTSGHRQSNVVVNIGHGNRAYWAYTNAHGQLVRVTAKEIILQNDETEDVNSSGRYYSKMADVPGVGAKYGYDRGHVIADSLGGVANAYNITPQEATLNRHGDQAYMERNIRDAGGATDFEAIITYPDTNTQIPSHYEMRYTIKGNRVVDKFENKNPDKVNQDLGITKPASKPSAPSKPESTPVSSGSSDLNKANPGNVEVGNVSAVDTNGNGTVTIQEAKDAGFSMPIYQGHWLYEHMRDNNNNGMVGE